MSTAAAVDAVVPAVAERARGQQPSRLRSLVAAAAVGFAAAGVTYRLLRSAPETESADEA